MQRVCFISDAKRPAVADTIAQSPQLIYEQQIIFGSDTIGTTNFLLIETLTTGKIHIAVILEQKGEYLNC